VTSPENRVERIERHRDGSVRARGLEVDGLLDCFWEWFRADGTRLRTGSFRVGAQVGEWTTYDRDGNPHKVTDHGET
jgi:hypothetical protein